MKQSQLIVAVVLLAALIFVATFAMNYLGQAPPNIPEPTGPQTTSTAELVFDQRTYPRDGFSGLEWEEHTSGHIDYWFYNPSKEPIRIGLNRKSCRCAGVDLFVLPETKKAALPAMAATLWGTRASGLLPTILVGSVATSLPLEGVQPTELLRETEVVTVPPEGIGSVRLRFTGERLGRLKLDATLWYNNNTESRGVTLDLRLFFHEPLRVDSQLFLGVVRDSELEKGISGSFVCWSPTRPFFRLDAKASLTRGGPETDPFVVGTPELLGTKELIALDRLHNKPSPDGPGEYSGQILCAWRVPVTIKAVSADGKTPFDLGTFRRRVLISSPDIAGEPKSVSVSGRVRGVVEIGNEDDSGDINFGAFARKRGKTTAIGLHSDIPGVKLTFNRSRTPEYLLAKLKTLSSGADMRSTWQLTAEVLAGKAEGAFPRKGDPAYEDAAIYLEATVPGQSPRALRIPVRGTAGGE